MAWPARTPQLRSADRAFRSAAFLSLGGEGGAQVPDERSPNHFSGYGLRQSRDASSTGPLVPYENRT